MQEELRRWEAFDFEYHLSDEGNLDADPYHEVNIETETTKTTTGREGDAGESDMAATNGSMEDGKFPPMLLLCPISKKPYKYVTLYTVKHGTHHTVAKHHIHHLAV